MKRYHPRTADEFMKMFEALVKAYKETPLAELDRRDRAAHERALQFQRDALARREAKEAAEEARIRAIKPTGVVRSAASLADLLPNRDVSILNR